MVVGLPQDRPDPGICVQCPICVSSQEASWGRKEREEKVRLGANYHCGHLELTPIVGPLRGFAEIPQTVLLRGEEGGKFIHQHWPSLVRGCPGGIPGTLSSMAKHAPAAREPFWPVAKLGNR